MQLSNPQLSYFSPQMQKNNFESTESDQEKDSVCKDETPSDWEFSGVTFFRAMGFVIGLLSFMVGTAIFMLGFSLARPTLVQVASFLYSLALISLLGRIVIQRLKPENEIQAVWIAMVMMGAGGVFFVGLAFLAEMFL